MQFSRVFWYFDRDSHLYVQCYPFFQLSLFMKQRFVLSLIAVTVLSSIVSVAYAASIFLYSSFQLHGFDDAILTALGYENGAVVYFSELGSITSEQKKVREEYEEFGCYPFALMRDGKAEESGYNCGTFFCVGYTKGPKICRDTSGKSYSGVVEITRRRGIPVIELEEKTFASFDAQLQTSAMKARITELAAVRCSPFYSMLFDVAVGEGYHCEEVGAYPYYSNKNTCVNDWRTSEEMTCDVTWRDNEFEYRRNAIDFREGGSSASSESSEASSASSSSSAPAVTFSDVLQGHYGFTAIMDLAARGIIKGYSDGTYQPYQTVNRAEFSKLLIGGLHTNQLRGEHSCFPDVVESWFSPFVCAAKRLQWLKGYPDGTFKPEQTIKKSEAMKIIVSSIGVPLDSLASLPAGTPDGQWYSVYIRKAMELNLILEPSFNPEADVTRSDAAVWIYRTLKALGR